MGGPPPRSIMESLLNASAQKPFLKRLLAWYTKEGRHDMPWRQTNDPYAIFVSEIMLQQTTVATVRPYYERFLRRFPTVGALAAADLNDVLALWSGLGYYARARNLWAAMQTVQKEHGGRIPGDVEALLKLPGVGYYTAGAITTIGFNRSAAVLDGNITRVIMRLLALDEEPRLKAVQAILRRAVQDLTMMAAGGKKALARGKRGGPRDVILALFDLGATVCVPRAPACLSCPVSRFCLAFGAGRQEEIPPPKNQADRPVIRRLHAVIRHEGMWLLGQRPKNGLFGGLWEFPGVEVDPGVNPVLFLEEAMLSETGLPVRVSESMTGFGHQLTHREMIIRPYLCKIAPKFKGKVTIPAAGKSYTAFRWATPAHLDKLGISSITRRIFDEASRPSDAS